MTDEEYEAEVKAFCNSPAIERLFNDLETSYLASWRATKPEDSQHREHLYRIVATLATIRNEMRSIAQKQRISEHNKRLR